MLALHFLFGLFHGWSFFRGAFISDFVLLNSAACCVLCFQRRRLPGALLFTLSAGILFLAVDLKYLFHQEWPRVSDLLLLDELFTILPLVVRVAVLLCVIGIAGGVIKNFRSRTLGQIFSFLLPPLSVVLLSVSAPGALLGTLEKIHPHVVWDGNSFLQKGVLFALFYDIPRTASLKAQFDAFKALHAETADSALTLSSLAEKRNVHIFVMESFMDPIQMGFQLPVDPIDSRMRQWFAGESLSPAYGGATAQAEFEIFCGIPARYDLADYIVFNNLGGKPVDCLPHLLAKLGYATISTVAAPRSYYNYGKAYSSLGFSTMLFEEAFPGEDRDGVWISNDEHVALNRETLRPFLENDVPLLNYMLTSSGHFSYQLNERKRPPVIQTGLGTQLTHLANNLYYNSRSIAEHIDDLLVKDPAAIIVVIGDHQGYLHEAERVTALPRKSQQEARRLFRKNSVPYLFLDAGEEKGSGLIAHYEIPHMILASLKGDVYVPMTERYGFDMIRPFFHTIFYLDEETLGMCPDENDNRCSSLVPFLESSSARLIGMIERSRMQ